MKLDRFAVIMEAMLQGECASPGESSIVFIVRKGTNRGRSSLW